MSIFANRFIAETIARCLNLLSYAFIRRDLRFEDIPARRSEITAPTRHGDIRCTKYLPPVATRRPGVYVNFHGGGFVFRDLGQDDPLCRYLAERAGVVVLNVDYSVAPGARFPVPVEEAYDLVQWASTDGHEWDGSRLCVGGQSAGGNLAAAAARLSLEQGGPAIALQVLHYAPLDLVTDRPRAAARRRQVVPSWLGTVFSTAYAPDAAMRRHRLASPAWNGNAEGLEGIAPALVITAEFDMLHDEGVAYARALESAGALVEHVEVSGADHAYNILGSNRAQTEHVYAAIAAHVRRAVGAALS